MPRTCVDVLRLFPSPGVFHQEMIGAPSAEVAAEVVFVGDGVSVVGVEPNWRYVEGPGRNLLRIICSRCRRLSDAGTCNSRFTCKIIWHPQRELFLEHEGPACSSLVIIRGFAEFLGDFHTF